MILADKIMNERKKTGMSQEELAEKLSVSRQSVSKWEGAQAVPDLQRIIQMAEIFGVTTDYLLRDEIQEIAVVEEALPERTGAAVRKVSLEEANQYLQIRKKNIPLVTTGVSLCILSPAFMITLLGLAEKENAIWGETVAVAVGLPILLVLVMISVALFLYAGAKEKAFEYLEKEEIETEYGVTGMVKEARNATEPKRLALLISGVGLCIVSAIPLLITSLLECSDAIILMMVAVLLGIIAIAVNLIVRSSMIEESWQRLLQEGDYTVKEKGNAPLFNSVAQIYWTIVTAIYIGVSFLTGLWGISWVIWPIAAMIYGVIVVILRAVVTGSKK